MFSTFLATHMATESGFERAVGAGLHAVASSKLVDAVAGVTDGCARTLGRGLARGVRGLLAASRLGARVASVSRELHRAGGPSPHAQLAGALALVPPLAELSGGPLAGRAAGLGCAALVLGIAARSVRQVVAREGEPGEAWAPVFRAALASAHDERRCTRLELELATSAAHWLERDLHGLPALQAKRLVRALVARAPARFSALPADALVDALPRASKALALMRGASQARASIALIELVEREAARLMARPPAEIVMLWPARAPAALEAASPARARAY